jgi:branched-chain amino acid transport system substrate-binding protein
VLFQGIAKAGKDDPLAVAKAMEGMTFSVVSGDITFDAQHNPVKAAAILQVTGGNVNFVTSVAP